MNGKWIRLSIDKGLENNSQAGMIVALGDTLVKHIGVCQRFDSRRLFLHVRNKPQNPPSPVLVPDSPSENAKSKQHRFQTVSLIGVSARLIKVDDDKK